MTIVPIVVLVSAGQSIARLAATVLVVFDPSSARHQGRRAPNESRSVGGALGPVTPAASFCLIGEGPEWRTMRTRRTT
jgi:hypothetical protein